MVDATVAFGGKIDILVNNAAIDPGGSVVDLDPDVWHAVIETNLTGPFYTMKFAIPYMIENGGGAIINISSLASVRCIPTMAPYCASKAGLNHLTNQVALDFGKHGIRAVSVLPGPVRTEMSEHSLGGMADAMGCDMDGVFSKLTCTLPLERVSHPAGDRRGGRLPGQRRRQLHHRRDHPGGWRRLHGGPVRRVPQDERRLRLGRGDAVAPSLRSPGGGTITTGRKA